MAFGDIIRFPLFAIRLLQWAFIVIALGLFSKFIERDDNGAHIIFEEVVYAIATAFYIPILIGSFLKNKLVARVSFLFDLIFSQLYVILNVNECEIHVADGILQVPCHRRLHQPGLRLWLVQTGAPGRHVLLQEACCPVLRLPVLVCPSFS